MYIVQLSLIDSYVILTVWAAIVTQDTEAQICQAQVNLTRGPGPEAQLSYQSVIVLHWNRQSDHKDKKCP